MLCVLVRITIHGISQVSFVTNRDYATPLAIPACITIGGQDGARVQMKRHHCAQASGREACRGSSDGILAALTGAGFCHASRILASDHGLGRACRMRAVYRCCARTAPMGRREP